jgi:DNA-binding transcriptional regulator GbsR (MarR family)
VDESERIRRDFAAGWARVGEAWGIAPSTAAVQGYLLLAPGPLTEAELRDALGLSHRAAFGALAECERWGLVEQVEPHRTGRRGPAGRAWVAVGDHWEWFRRVVGSRKARETDPTLPLLEACLERAAAAGDVPLGERIGSLVSFVREFDRGVGVVVGSDAATLARLFGVLGRLDDTTLRSLFGALAAVPSEELATAATRVATMRPAVLRRLLRLAGQPGVARLLDRFG